MPSQALLQRLLLRGDYVAIEQGRLVIIPSNTANQVPSDWIAENKAKIISEALALLGVQAYQYVGFKTGRYFDNKAEAVQLQFESMLDHSLAFAFFNVSLTRDRNSKHGKKGERLPKKQFRPPARGEFIAFWRRAGHTEPKRRGSFHDYMGKLKELIFVAEFVIGSKLDAKFANASLALLNVSYEQLIQALNGHTTTGQKPHNSQTIYPDKQMARSQNRQSFESDLTTDRKECIQSKQGGEVYSTIDQRVREQSIDEWLEEYSSAKVRE